MDEKEFYIYALTDEDGIFRYIGKANTSYNRIQRHFKKSSNSTVRELINNKWESKILFQSPDEKEVLNIERDLIAEYKPTLYNKTRGGEGGPTREGDGNSITLKGIHTNELLHFKSQIKAAKHLNVSTSSVSLLAKGKYLHIGGEWTLESIDPATIPRYKSRKSGYKVEKAYKPIKIYDHEDGKYLNFDSQQACVKFTNCSSSNVTLLYQGKLNTIKNGRFSLSKDIKGVRKPCKILDTLTGEITSGESIKEVSMKTNLKRSMLQLLVRGKMKKIYNRYTLAD